MKYTSKDYDLLDKTALQLRMDYGFLTESLDIYDLAIKIGIILTPYSKLSSDQLCVINKSFALEDGFTVIRCENETLKHYTFYNDRVNKNRQRFTIAHEIKHIIFNEFNPDEKQEDLANHFARYILAPSCMVMKHINESPYEIASIFEVSHETADYAMMAIKNRLNFNKEKLTNYEELFLKEANL